jgi:formylmethanofuran dehydrogenase subunit E
MNPEDIAKFIESLNVEQKEAFEKVFKTIGNSMGVEIKQEEVEVEEPIQTTENNKDDFTMHKNNAKPKGRREAVKFKKNTWQDDGTEFSDMETPKVKRTPRNRKKANVVDVECHVCGKTFKMNSNLVYGEYQRCNRCGGK